ncbi:hypothetical protein BDV32DRAFT_153618 [Aspergillus pseudonomiae]|uniref:Uncharacterized protein n=1 Tax=Aspergillus pseudonomiae TaxID=1506151 RepID=A0A5N7D6K1_9EURO|nr:uncharacterized protein BDV37DRAFT_285151 [Aspergillus pseudonomiae]KAB8256069.1 hypothetical protein BDV32DRAFT_153618 [Aspergillus pseudonomiae]KAE8402031.1 hypothetical protein BDV37DRAFT_285151 [Aspergillus pseudonomiae]
MATLSTPIKPLKRATASPFDAERKDTLRDAGLSVETHTNTVAIYLDIDPWTDPLDPADVILASRRELERKMTMGEEGYANASGIIQDNRIRVYWGFPSEAQTAEEVFKEAWIYNMAFEDVAEKGKKKFTFPAVLDECCLVDVFAPGRSGTETNVSVTDAGYSSWEAFLANIKPAFPSKDKPGTYCGF